ncbi:GNAT family N-acetyltransferase [Paraburkholderia nodosa]|uniref:GNAT family N-acetyltransferase n=1 Tax=Paraburkholderia nodosa TaxID=392320 RepID=UPI0004837C8D|nr:GNAT family protein [Paraburkholderia nodosa]
MTDLPGRASPTAAEAIPAPHDLPTLNGRTVALHPLCAQDAPRLVAAAADGELWNLKVTVVPGPATVDAWIARALDGVSAGTVIPFTIRLRESDRVVGSTCFWKVDRENRKLEIGSTWLAASAQRTIVNTEVKFLMLSYAFETLGCVRVQFTTDVLNAKSRAAILRLGAKEEGVVRRERIMPDGRKRDSVRFSIIEDEWPEVKAGLLRRLLGAG